MPELLEELTAVSVFPIKSCQAATIDGAPADRLDVGMLGLEKYDVRDREFVIFDAEPLTSGEHLFVTQRGWDENHRAVHRGDSVLATVKTDISSGKLAVQSAVGEFSVSARHPGGGKERAVKIFSSSLRVLDQGAEAAEHFSDLLGRSVRLGRHSRWLARALEAPYRRDGASNRYSGSDGSPLLIVNEASLATALEQAGQQPGSTRMDSYRGNMQLKGNIIGPFGEDSLLEIKIGKTSFFIVKACARCPMPNIDQLDGERTAGGMKILGSAGRKGVRNQGAKTQMFFGQNATYTYEPGQTVGVGDTVEIIETAEKPNFIAT